MMWVVASIPLWMTGAFSLFVSIYGICRISVRTKNHPEDISDFAASIVFMCVSIVALYLAAKLAS